MEPPKLSSRFDVDDIRKLRDYNSWRHNQMTPEEANEDIHRNAQEFLRELEAYKAKKLAESQAVYSAKEPPEQSENK